MSSVVATVYAFQLGGGTILSGIDFESEENACWNTSHGVVHMGLGG